jgi:hypothetical protein
LARNRPFQLVRLTPEGDGTHSAAWRDVLQPLNLRDLTGLNTNEADLQERESVARAKRLAGMTDGSNPERAGDDGDSLGEDVILGVWDDVEVYGDPYQHGQRARRLSWIWLGAGMEGEAGDSRRRLGACATTSCMRGH